MVLLDNIQKVEIEMSLKHKLRNRWIGPYVVTKANELKGTYELREPGGPKKQGTFARDRLKKFVQREDGYWESPEEDIDRITDVEFDPDGRAKELAEEAAVREWHDMVHNEEIREDYHPVVEIPALPQEVRNQYMAFADSDEEETSSGIGRDSEDSVIDDNEGESIEESDSYDGDAEEPIDQGFEGEEEEEDIGSGGEWFDS